MQKISPIDLRSLFPENHHQSYLSYKVELESGLVDVDVHVESFQSLKPTATTTESSAVHLPEVDPLVLPDL